jgi:hypothetical protein
VEKDLLELAQLRREARVENVAGIEARCREGEDPWDFLPELPTVDQCVVIGLRTAHVEQRDPSEPRLSNFEILRSIAYDYPELRAAAWSLVTRR